MFKKFLPLNIFLLGLVIFLTARFVQTMRTSSSVDTMGPVIKGQYQHESLLPRKKIRPINYYSVIPRNDLFSPERQPPGDDDEGEDSDSLATPPNEDYILHGTILIGEEKVAFVEDKKTRAVERYYLGDKIGDFTVTEMARDEIILSKKTRRESIRLFEADRKKTTSRKPSPRTRRKKPLPGRNRESRSSASREK